jgi:hypothetical protein
MWMSAPSSRPAAQTDGLTQERHVVLIGPDEHFAGESGRGETQHRDSGGGEHCGLHVVIPEQPSPEPVMA